MQLALVGATIYTGPFEDAITDGVVITNDAYIAAVGTRSQTAIPDDARIVECHGLTVTAGFWNGHVHFFERKWADAATRPAVELAAHLAEYLRFGFTSVVDLSSLWSNTRALRDRIASGEIAGPHIYSTGEGLVPPKALPPDIVLEAMGLMPTPLPEVRDASEAAAKTTALIERGVDAAKMFASGSGPASHTLSLEIMQATVKVAHASEKLVFVHPNTSADIERALAAGVDVIAHTTPRAAWSAELLSAVARLRPAITPTLMLWKDDGPAAAEQLRAWIAHGGVVLFGTDAGAAPIDPSAEYALMTDAGMGFREILASLTATPARLFGVAAQFGRVAAGFAADLVAFEGSDLARVRYVVARGLLT